MIDSVIFDFDDTLVATNAGYDNKRLELYELMRGWGIGGEAEWPDFLDAADISFVHQAGHLSPDCFPRAMRYTCSCFAERSGIELPVEVLDRAERIGWSVYTTQPERIEGAEEILSYLQGRVRLYLLTEGHPDIQLPRLKQSGFLPFFEQYHIVTRKDVAAYRRLIGEHNIDPARSWMVGNSVRSDVNPSLRVGLRCAYFTRSAWSYDHEELIGDPSPFAALSELPKVMGI